MDPSRLKSLSGFSWIAVQQMEMVMAKAQSCVLKVEVGFGLGLGLFVMVRVRAGSWVMRYLYESPRKDRSSRMWVCGFLKLLFND